LDVRRLGPGGVQVHQLLGTGVPSFSIRTAVDLNSAVPEIGSETSIVSRFVGTLRGKWNVMKQSPRRSARSYRAQPSREPRRDVTRPRSPSAIPSLAPSSGAMSTDSPRRSGDE